MKKLDVERVIERMQLGLCMAIEEGKEVLQDEDGNYNGDEFFGFSPYDVAEVHITKVTHDVWYRLKDGRVFDNAANECEPDRKLYDVGITHRLLPLKLFD